MKIHRLDPVIADAPIMDEICAAAEAVLRSGTYIGGAEVTALERELGELLGRVIVSTGSGTDALAIALMALARPLQSSKTVIVPTLSFSATASAVCRAGLRPIFVDVDPETLLIDWEQAADACRHDPVAVIPVHLYGQVAEIPSTWCESVPVLEDACQAFGAQSPRERRLAGSLGTASAFSFFPSKPLGACGDAGFAAFADEELAARARVFAHHGAQTRYISDVIGFNSRLDAIQAAILRVKLKYVRQARDTRDQIAEFYTDRLGELDWIRVPKSVSGHAWHCYTIRVNEDRRDALIDHVRQKGIEAIVQYPVPLHLQPAFRDPSAFPSRLPHAERACRELLCLPIWAGMTQEDAETVVSAIEDF